MRIFTIITLCLMPVTQASATEFRCYPPDPASYFQAVQASPDQYRIVVGLFDFDPALLPNASGADLFPTVQPIPAQFTGQALGPDGPGADVAFDLTILPSCIMVTCATLTPGLPTLAFLRQAETGPVLDLYPCNTPLFAPMPETLVLLSACLRGAAC